MFLTFSVTTLLGLLAVEITNICIAGCCEGTIADILCAEAFGGMGFVDQQLSHLAHRQHLSELIPHHCTQHAHQQMRPLHGDAWCFFCWLQEPQLVTASWWLVLGCSTCFKSGIRCFGCSTTRSWTRNGWTLLPCSPPVRNLLIFMNYKSQCIIVV